MGWLRPRVPSHSPLYRQHVSGRSPAWRSVCRLAVARDRQRCAHRSWGVFRCSRRWGLGCHHRHYRHLGFEWSERVPVPRYAQDAWRKAGYPTTCGESVTMLCSRHHARADARRRRRTRRVSSTLQLLLISFGMVAAVMLAATFLPR